MRNHGRLGCRGIYRSHFIILSVTVTSWVLVTRHSVFLQLHSIYTIAYSYLHEYDFSTALIIMSLITLTEKEHVGRRHFTMTIWLYQHDSLDLNLGYFIYSNFANYVDTIKIQILEWVYRRKYHVVMPATPSFSPKRIVFKGCKEAMFPSP